MDGRQTLTERILTAPGRVVLLRGPAACGKTTAALGMYRHFCRPESQGRCLLLVPGAAAAAYARSRLVADSPNGVAVAPQVQTFAGLAGRILSASGGAGRLVSALHRHVLLGRIVEGLSAAGKIPALQPVADTPGLLVALDRAIAELKRAAVEPDALERALSHRRKAGPGAKTRDLLAVYRAYQDRLHEGNRYDLEGRMWETRDLLAAKQPAGEAPGLEGLAALAADGFTDFTPTQLEILALLSKRLERVLITLPHAEDGRDRMWHWAARTLTNLRKAFGAGLQEVEAVPDASRQGPGGLPRSLWDTVFDFDAAPTAPPKGLHVIAAAGTDAEVAAVARKIKRLLVDGAAPGSIAVVARTLDAYRPHVERIFAECDIPVAEAPLALTDVPVIRYILGAASLAPDFPFRDVLRVIKSSYFRPQALGDYGPDTVATAEMLIRRGNVLGGREAYARAAERFASCPPRGDEEDDDTVDLGPLSASPAAVRGAAEMLGHLFDLAEAPVAGPSDRGSGAAARQSALERLAAMTAALGVRDAAADLDEPELLARGLRALAELARAIAEIPADVGDLQRIRELLGTVTCPPARCESAVDVMDVLDARGLRYEHVFLLGTGEGQFPRRLAEGALIRESDRTAWAHRGVHLDARSDLTAREMLLFYLAVSRADRTLTVSFQESDAAGRPGAAGSFLESLLAPFGGLEEVRRRGLVQKIPPGQFLPAPEDLSSRREALSAAVAGLFDLDGQQGAAALSWAATNAAETIRQSAIGLYARARRWAPDECDHYDGRLTNRKLLAALAERYPGQTVFSATQINAYGQCPWAFFARYVLGLEALEVPERRLEPVARGIFCHNVLFRTLVRLRAECGGPVRLADLDEPAVLQALDDAVRAESAAVDSFGPPYPVLWRIQQRQMRQELAEYLRGQRADGAAAEAMHFELSFGFPRTGADLRDPAGREEPVALALPTGEIRVRGKIDRVDRVRLDDAEGLLVVDYKTGKLPKKDEVLAGRNVQLPLYALAAEQVLRAPCLGGTFHKIGARTKGPSERLFAAIERAGDGYRPSEDYEKDRDTVLARIAEFVDGMRSGRFDVLPTDTCPRYCAYRRICHYSEARAERKAPPDDEEAAE